MGVNQAEDRPEKALINEIVNLRTDFNEFRTTPQKIGNGSLNYAVFDQFNGGPFTVPSGLTARYTVKFMATGVPFTFDGRPAIPRVTLGDLYWSVKVDVNDIDHVIPYGAALAGPETLMIPSQQFDYYQSGLSESDGQMWVTMQVTNIDTVTHSYWISGRLLIPRPALKPQ